MSSITTHAPNKTECDVILVDDDPDVRTVLATLLAGEGFTCELAADGKEALQLLQHVKAKLIMVDIYMPNMDGLEVIPYCSRHHPNVPIVAMSGGGRAGGADWFGKAAEMLGARCMLEKPFELPDVVRLVRSILSPQT